MCLRRIRAPSPRPSSPIEHRRPPFALRLIDDHQGPQFWRHYREGARNQTLGPCLSLQYYHMHLTHFYFTQPSITECRVIPYWIFNLIDLMAVLSTAFFFFDRGGGGEKGEGKLINRFVDTAASRFRTPQCAPFSAVVCGLHPHTPLSPLFRKKYYHHTKPYLSFPPQSTVTRPFFFRGAPLSPCHRSVR